MTYPKTFVRVFSVAILLAAVLAWGGLSSAFAAPDSISINFGPHFGAPTGGDLGAVPVNYQYWNNAISTEGIGLNKYTASGNQNQYNKAGTFNNQIDNPQFFTSNLISNTGKDTGLTATWTCNNTYLYSKTRPSTNNNAILFYGYLDDGNGNQKFNMTAPYFAYDIYYYATTDSNGYRYATINSVNYYGNGSQTVQGTSNWGTLVRGNINQVIEGQHYLKVSSSDSAISIAGVGIDSSSSKRRGSFGALQIVNTYNSQSTITSENSLDLANATWDNDLTGATNQGFNPSVDGYRIIYTGEAIDTFTVDLNGTTRLPNVKLIGSATNLAFTGTVSQMGKTNTVTDFTKMAETVTIPNLAQVAPQGVVKLGANTTFTEMPTSEGNIPGAYYVNGTTISFAKIAKIVNEDETVNYVLAPVVPTYQAAPTDGMDLTVTAKITDNETRTLNSLTSSFDYLNNSALTITSGNIMLNNRNHWVQGGGTITSGYQNADGEYDLYLCAVGTAEDMRIDSSRVVNNPDGKLNLIKTGSGKAGLTNYQNNPSLSNEYSGKTSVLEGCLFFGIKNSSTQFFVAHGATLDFSCRSIKGGNYSNFGDIDFTAAELTGYGTVIVGNSSTVGSLTLNNVANDGSTFTTVTVEGKYLTLNHSELNAQTINNSSVINLNDQSTLTAGLINGSANSIVKISADSTLNLGGVAGKVTLEIPANVTKTFSNEVGGPGELILDGGGTLTLKASNTYSGGTTVKNGTLKLGKTGGTATLNPKSPVTVDGETSILTGAGDVLGYTDGAIGRLTLQNGGTLNSEGGSHMTVNNVIYMNNGKITAPETGSGTGNYIFDNAFHVTGGTENEISALSIRLRSLNNTPFETGDSAGKFDVAQGAKLTISSVIDSDSTANITKAGAGELVLTGNSPFNKNVTVNGGVLDLTKGKLYSGKYVSGGNVYVNDGGTLKVNNFGYSEGGASSLGGLTYSSNGSTNVHLNGGTIQITESYGSSINRKVELQTNGGTLDLAEGVELTLAGDINGAGALTKAGAGTLELTNANTYAGGTTISQGVVNLSGAGSLGAGNVEIVNGAVLNFNHEGDATFNNSVSGSGTIYKNGSGTLRILNETPDNFTVESFVIKVGELDFKGYFKGILKVGSGAKFSPGNSVGKLTQDGTFILDSGSLLLIEQDSEGIDEIMAKEFNIDNGAVIEMSMGAVIPGAQYTLFTKTSGENFVDAYATDEFWNSLLTPESAYYWNLSVKDNVVYAQLDASAVPEPSTWALLILGAAGLLYWRKKNS